MLAVKSASIRKDFKSVCDKVVGGDVITVMRPGEFNNVVILSEERYAQLEKAERNAEYLAKIDRGFEQIRAGKGQVHELIED